MTNEQSLVKFQRELAKASKDLTERQFILFHKKVVLEALARIVQKTPVDTGRARGNWQVGIGQPITTETDAKEKSGAGTLNRGVTALASLPPFAVVFISNNVQYIEYLENGTSKQAPKGMIMVTIEELRGMFQ